MIRLAVSLILILSLSGLAQAQTRYTISGYVRDSTSGEPLIQATVLGNTNGQGTVTNSYGYYSLTLPASDTLQLRVSYVGYTPVVVALVLQENRSLNVVLVTDELLDEVVVESTDPIHEQTSMSVLRIRSEQVQTLPALLGEADILKTLQLMPGVQSGNEGTTGLYVRGGSPDQNLILLDGVPVYNVSHLFGFFSVFNPSSISYIELIKGGFPARYGGRLSSVLDIRMKEGNAKQFAGEATVGLISGSASIEGPIIKDKASFIVSARRTYLDLVARPLLQEFANDSEEGELGYYFYDLNAKVNARLGKKHHLFLSAYAGNDRGNIVDERQREDIGVQINSRDAFDLQWGNLTTALRWNYAFAPRWFMHTTLTYSRYDYENDVQYESTGQGTVPNPETGESELIKRYNFSRQRYRSSIEDYTARLDLSFTPNPKHELQTGANVIRHTFDPGAVNYVFDTLATDDIIAGDTVLGSDIVNAYESFIYLEDQWQPFPRFSMNLGVHASAFQVEGKTYTSVQPRASLRYLLGNTLALKASYARMTQYIHLLTNAGLGLPTDLWVPTTARIRPQQSQQWALGLAKTLPNGRQISVEGYYKSMDNLLEYLDGANFLDVEEDWQGKVAVGEGRSYGTELLVEQTAGKLTGWLGYTLSWTDRQFDEINFGERFPFRYDRRHDVSLTGSYHFTKSLTVSATGVFGSGIAITLPVSSYDPSEIVDIRYRETISEEDLEEIRSRNGFRMAPYHRVDINLQHSKEKKWGERIWTLGVYNVYNRRNPFFIDRDTLPSGSKQFVQYTLFPILPAVAYTLRFH